MKFLKWLCVIIYLVQSKAQTNYKIVGGKTATILDFPYLVGIFIDNNFACGGSIISEEWVLTAAHCARFTNKTYTVHAGSSLKHIGGTFHLVIANVMHPNFILKMHDYDFAVMKVFPPFFLSGLRYAAVDLVNEEPKPGDVVTIPGWGVLKQRMEEEDKLFIDEAFIHYTDLTVISHDDCAAAHQKENTTITDRMFCAAAPGKDTCQGDSGGPVLYKNTGKQVGVVSFGSGCADPKYPGAYSDIPNQIKWIREVTGLK